MKLGKMFYTADRKAWRVWLMEHYATEKEIWLVFPRKSSGRARLEYNDAVEEALCFGWIDSVVRGINGVSFAQRFSPRNPRSPYSAANKERLRKLIRQGKVLPQVRAAVRGVLAEKRAVPADILAALKADKEAWKNFRKFSPEYRRIRIGYIEGARKRPAEFRKRLAHFIAMTNKNKQFGFGGIKKHY